MYFMDQGMKYEFMFDMKCCVVVQWMWFQLLAVGGVGVWCVWCWLGELVLEYTCSKICIA